MLIIYFLINIISINKKLNGSDFTVITVMNKVFLLS